jgi:ribonuclease E
VPVDVASFLLNEKRSEVAKIELKQRINVLLVPNKTLETPNYKLERLKHDDPRLDNIEASYKMADVVEDPTSVTRRSQEPTNKQTPIIKGVLPDAPAPLAAPRPVAPVLPLTAPTAQQRNVPTPGTIPPVAAEKGFFGWIKSLFGSEPPAPVKPTVPAPAAKAPEGRETRDGRNRDGNRSGGKPGEGRGPDGQPRGDGRGPRNEGRGDGRNSRGGRGGRGGNGERQGGAQRERFDAEGKPMPMDASLQASSQAQQGPDANRQDPRPERAPRERGERGSRGGRGGERNENGERNEPIRTEGRNEPTADSGSDNAPRNEGGQPREARGEGRNGGRGGRNGRGPRPEGEAPRNANGENTQQTPQGFAETNQASSAVPVDAQLSGDVNDQAPRSENGEPREKRSRDRYGRERTPRGDRSEREERPDLRIPAQPAAQPAETAEAHMVAPQATPVVASVAPAMPEVSAVPPVRAVASAPAPVAAAAAPAVAVAAATVDRMPKVTSYTLPTETLVDVAQSTGLQWVNSDSAKIAAVQVAIAAEPKPIHVPRVRPEPVSIDAGPLVLVETKRDLRDMTLPFEQPPAA